MIKKLIQRLDEQYQDINFEGEYFKGKRDCVSRIDIISKHIPMGVVLDIGSAQGFYSSNFASNYRLMISVESEKPNVELQKHIFRYRKNIAICHKKLMVEDFKMLNKGVNPVDGILALSILHHFENPVEVVIEMSKLSPVLIVEIPHKNESNACGIKTRSILNKKLFESLYQTVELIGYGQSHMNTDLKRPIYLCKNSIYKQGRRSYSDNNEKDRKQHKLSFIKSNNCWLLNDYQIKYGINFYDLKKLGLVEQRVGMYKEKGIRAYTNLRLRPIFDIRLWNLVIGPSGMYAVDYIHRNEDVDLKESYEDWQELESMLNISK